MSQLTRDDRSVGVCRMWLWNARAWPHVGAKVAHRLQQVGATVFHSVRILTGRFNRDVCLVYLFTSIYFVLVYCVYLPRAGSGAVSK